MDRVAALKRCRLTETFSPTGLKILAAVAKERAVEAGEVVFSAGDAATGLFVIAEGMVSVRAEAPNGDPVELGRLRVGEPLGALSLLGAKTHLVTVEAAEPTLLVELTAEALKKLLEQKPQAALKLLLAISRDVGARLDTAAPQLRAFAVAQLRSS